MIRNLSKKNRRRLHVPIVDFIKNELTAYLNSKLVISIYQPEEDTRPAYVSYAPLTLNVSRGVWRAAELGNSDAEYVLAHEIGHLVLHQDFDKAFSPPNAESIRALGNERSAEWQANTFADYFLCPDEHIFRLKGDIESAATLLNISVELAEYRAAQVERFGPTVQVAVEGDFCGTCNTLGLVAVGTDVRCTNCASVYSR